MEKLNIKRFAGGGGDYPIYYNYAENADMKLNEDLKLGSSGISLSSFNTITS